MSTHHIHAIESSAVATSVEEMSLPSPAQMAAAASAADFKTAQVDKLIQYIMSCLGIFSNQLFALSEFNM